MTIRDEARRIFEGLRNRERTSAADFRDAADALAALARRAAKLDPRRVQSLKLSETRFRLVARLKASRARKDDAASPSPPWVSNVDWLTPAEIEALKRKAKEIDAYAKKAFAHLRPKPEEPGD